MAGRHANWHKRWTVDAAAREARHESGLVVAFNCEPHAGDAPRGAARNADQVEGELARTHGPHNAPAMLRRLIAEASQAYAYPMPHARHH
jgi:hypothetical protein